MKIVIIEDEQMAARSLEDLIREVVPDTEVLAVLQSIDESADWFRNTDVNPDLVFMDIHLADGSSFSIFDEVDIDTPVIFTTAYDKYALKAFEVNSVDYLLKPINKSDLERAVNKYRTLAANHSQAPTLESRMLLKQLADIVRLQTSIYKTSLLVNMRDKFIPVAVKDIAFIHIDSKVITAYLFGGRSYILEQTLDELSTILDPGEFFRANRQFIISRSAVKDISSWFGGKLSVNLSVPAPERIFVSKARVREFKNWITG